MTWASDYATLAEGRDHLRITDAADTADDAEIGVAITAASRAIDKAAGRQFGILASATARLYTAVYDKTLTRYVVSVDDFQTVTGLVVKTDLDRDGVYETTLTDFIKLPLNAAGRGVPWNELVIADSCARHVGGMEVTALFGWTAVPTPIKQATLLQMARIVKRRDAPFGVTGSPDMDNQTRLLARIDPDVQVLVNLYRRLH
jgi:hypothetical protein